MRASYVAYSIPFFFLLIGLEVLVGRMRGMRLYRFADSITSLACGVGQQALRSFFDVLTVAAYAWVFDRLAIAHASPRSPLAWGAAVVGVDLAYYAWHRASHRVNFLWAGHVVHHQSEEYNLSTALRQSWFASLTAWPFYLPLAVVGFPPEMFVGALTLDILYQFWIHTRTVRTLGPLEWVFNTPSHHRVHHGINPRYIDKNYAGIFIVWDRLFGTFEPEREPAVYGLVKPLASFNPAWANVHYWVEMARMANASPRAIDKLRAFVAPPEWRPAALGGPVAIPDVSDATRPKYDVATTPAMRAYVAASFVVVGIVLTGSLLVEATAPRWALAVVALVVVATLASWGALLEGRAWGLPFELVRLASIPIAATAITWGSAALGPAATASAVVAVAFGAWVLASNARLRRSHRAEPALPDAPGTPHVTRT
jgi:alkylglycerol monooxygenase